MDPAGAPGSVLAGATGGGWPRRILVVARWYPSHDDPGSGSFVSDEVAALRAAGIDVVVASWENADLRSRDGEVEAIRRPAVAAWARAVAQADALSAPRAWGAGVPVARIPVLHPGGRLPARVAIDSHAALLVPFATALAERWPFDLVHAHVGIPEGAAAARVAAALGLPLLVTEHSSSATEQLEEEDARSAYLELRGDGRRVVAVSRALAARLETSLGLERGAIPVVPNIIRFDGFPLGVPGDRDPEELLWVGARREHKGTDLLIRAVAIAREQRPGLHLRLVGRAPDQAGDKPWRDLAEQVGLGDAVAFEPPTDRAGVAAAMRRAGIFVHPSPYETFGMVAAEALASGLPVAARRSGGVEEILAGEDVGAELADGDDPAALAAAILRLRSRLTEVDPAAIRSAVTGRFPTAGTIAALLGHARDAAAELPATRGRSAVGMTTEPAAAGPMPAGAGPVPAVAGPTPAASEARPADAPLPSVLVVGLRRTIAARRVAALPPSLASSLTVVTTAEAGERDGMLPSGARWIEIDPDATYARRLAGLGGPLDVRRTTLQRLVAACLHPRRSVLRRQLLDERPALRAAAERDGILGGWRALASGPGTNGAVIVALGAEDVVAAADALGAGGVLAPGGLRWLADAWDAAGRP
jgi:glycosyltransferase involved in cell wall biosynthesis